ncbi:T6SS immunity protein Tdi1 domain-containing protein [Nocardia sp. XZ_19_385]|uniref:T6SS immunity protein Tdi1 domain-containing protein n=1 Tax=Nocardia sp. XZ_19_385 TaxID=2769488 RepID=UPI00188F43AF|nr:T6SS immunity protein Tdi1 domain-containing protein [Nocardia sp. XZ_19_385]
MELIKSFTTEQFESALASWEWIGLEGKTPLCASLFGDVFFDSEEGLWWLDTLNGELTRPWDNADDLEKDLDTEDGMEQYLLATLAADTAETGLVPAENEVYDFTQPPILGGELEVGNVQVNDFVSALNVAGQIHARVADLPPGAEVDPQLLVIE